MATILHLLKKWADERPDDIAQVYKQDGRWIDVSIRKMSQSIENLASHFKSKGLEKGDTVGIFAYNTPEWTHCQLAVELVGGIPFGIYPNASSKDISNNLLVTMPKFLIVEDQAYFERVPEIPECVEEIFVMKGPSDFSDRASSLGELIAVANDSVDFSFNKALAKLNKDTPALIVFTSGTTGMPKGAVLSHENLVFPTEMTAQAWGITNYATSFSFLPLCHIGGQVQTITTGIIKRNKMYFCTGFTNIAEEFREIQPNLCFSVPRVFEKMQEGIEQKLKSSPFAAQKLFGWAFSVTEKVTELKIQNAQIGIIDRIEFRLAQPFIEKIKKAVGFGNCLCAAAGSAKVSVSTKKWFRKLGIDIQEMYGQSESGGPVSITFPGKSDPRTVGYPLPGTQCRIAADGEIQVKGPNVFLGYFKNLQATAETLKDGWLATGDLGEINKKGELKIIGRKKEIIKTSGGKMIAPSPIESNLERNDMIEQACLVGDNRKYISALLTINPQAKSKYSGEEIQKKINSVVSEVNMNLARFEQIKKFEILDRPFTIENGEVTPTLKIKRGVIEKRFQSTIDQMYR